MINLRDIVACLAVGLFAGCNASSPLGGTSASGGAGSSSASGTTPGSASPDGGSDTLSLTTRTTRTLQVDDSWTYDERQETTVDGETTTTVGTHVHLVRPDVINDLAGNPVRVMSAILDTTVGDENQISKSALSYFSQSSQGTFFQHGRLNAYVNPPVQRFVAFPSGGRYAIIISPIAVGNTASWDVVFDDGARLTGESTVVSLESVEVPAGSFVAARVEVTDTEVKNDVTNSWNYTLWYVPELGRDVKAEFDLIMRDNRGRTIATGHRVRELTETNVVAMDAEGDQVDESTEDGDAETDSEESVDDVAPDDEPEQDAEDEPEPDEPDHDHSTDGPTDSGTDGVEETIDFEPLPEGAALMTSASGLEYFHFEEGDGQQPHLDSTVTVDYVGFLEDGTVFDQGQAVQFNLGSVVAGFAEGIALMQVGGASRFVLPPELGYGSSGNPGAGIEGDVTIIFDVTLISLDVL